MGVSLGEEVVQHRLEAVGFLEVGHVGAVRERHPARVWDPAFEFLL